MKKAYQNIPYFLLFLFLVAVDRISKIAATNGLKDHTDYILIEKVLRFQYLENRGAAWGIFQGHTWLFSLITIIVFVVITIFLYKIPVEKRYFPLRMTLVVLCAGAIGNFIDRIINGYVVDFIYFEIINFPIFNIADIYVCISVFLLLYLLIFHYKEEELTWKKN